MSEAVVRINQTVSAATDKLIQNDEVTAPQGDGTLFTVERQVARLSEIDRRNNESIDRSLKRLTAIGLLLLQQLGKRNERSPTMEDIDRLVKETSGR